MQLAKTEVRVAERLVDSAGKRLKREREEYQALLNELWKQCQGKAVEFYQIVAVLWHRVADHSSGKPLTRSSLHVVVLSTLLSHVPQNTMRWGSFRQLKLCITVLALRLHLGMQDLHRRP